MIHHFYGADGEPFEAHVLTVGDNLGFVLQLIQGSDVVGESHVLTTWDGVMATGRYLVAAVQLLRRGYVPSEINAALLIQHVPWVVRGPDIEKVRELMKLNQHARVDLPPTGRAPWNDDTRRAEDLRRRMQEAVDRGDLEELRALLKVAEGV